MSSNSKIDGKFPSVDVHMISMASPEVELCVERQYVQLSTQCLILETMFIEISHRNKSNCS